MNIFVYVSDKTEQTIITKEDHGLTWELGNDTFDLMRALTMVEDGNFIVLDTRASSAVLACEEDFIE